jgi:hypothetical protein
MKNPGSLFDPARAGDLPSTTTFPPPLTPEKQEPCQACVTSQQMTISRQPDGELLDGLMSVSYLLPLQQATVTAWMQTHEEQAAVCVQYVCQVDEEGPITHERLAKVFNAPRKVKQDFLARKRETRQWFVAAPLELSHPPTYNFLADKIREVLPVVYERMSVYPDGMEQAAASMQELLGIYAEEEEPAAV